MQEMPLNDDEPTTSAPPLHIEKRLARAINSLGVDLYRHLVASPGNTLFSPLSISTALAMTAAGARGKTATQMARALHVEMPPEELHKAILKLISSVEAEGERPITLKLANRLFGERSFSFKQPFLTLTRERYRAELEPVDFQNVPQKVRGDINEWVARQTND